MLNYYPKQCLLIIFYIIFIWGLGIGDRAQSPIFKVFKYIYLLLFIIFILFNFKNNIYLLKYFNV